jgi:GNAT superfamily N-acetyltransferase
MSTTEPSAARIRRAGPADAALLAELGARTFHETFAADNRPEDMAAYLASAFSVEQTERELSDPRSIWLVAEIDGAAAGYAKLYAGAAPECVRGPDPVELARIYAARAWLGRGVGALLLRACLEEARRGGHRTIWLGVWERNERARAFYRKWDFRDAGTQIFQLGSDTQTDVVMEREL